MSRASVAERALARSYGVERTLTLLVGLLALAAGCVVLLVSLGVLGSFRAQRPVLDPLAVDWLQARPEALVKSIVIAAALALFACGMWWLVRSLRPEPRPDFALDRTPGEEVTVTATAIAAAVQADAEQVTGVTKARARSVGDEEQPALRLSLWLRQGTDVRQVWEELDITVLAPAREALGVQTLPTAVRLELDTVDGQRVR
ncbi:hypothetical protein SAMN05216266_11213 [Amycolatopsis marina]|uniref:Alkaline shock response membrane anchor protein AmaP n=1 Tax=Amycolatopsis marina TaxID=490629 RepID=A0A1I1B4M8_9PSEU|nr:alkaline shock response membrane anchor protein AmaP [Amycolatopsis marina]SFB45191.1 hypothetical protein SAMN05216266_11213 [Amycolatopsis marina]